MLCGAYWPRKGAPQPTAETWDTELLSSKLLVTDAQLNPSAHENVSAYAAQTISTLPELLESLQMIAQNITNQIFVMQLHSNTFKNTIFLFCSWLVALMPYQAITLQELFAHTCSKRSKRQPAALLKQNNSLMIYNKRDLWSKLSEYLINMILIFQ